MFRALKPKAIDEVLHVFKKTRRDTIIKSPVVEMLRAGAPSRTEGTAGRCKIHFGLENVFTQKAQRRTEFLIWTDFGTGVNMQFMFPQDFL